MAKAHFLARVLRFSLPAGLGAGAAALGVYGVSRNIVHAPPDQARMATLLALFVVAMFVLGWLSRPLSAWRTLLVVAMGISGALLVGEPWLRGLFAFAVPSVRSLFTVAAVTTPVLAVLSLLLGRRSGCRSPRENRDLRSWPGIP
jgi:cation-transporting ATPase E